MDQRELESELQNMMKLHAEGVKQVKKMERIVRESDQRAKVSSAYDLTPIDAHRSAIKSPC